MGSRVVLCRWEALESRMLMSAVAPSDYEQYMLELVNRARANPSAEAARYGIDLNEGLAPGTISSDAKQPLAFNPYIIDGARQHSQWMIDNDVFSHTGAGGSNPGGRMASAGYGSAGTFGWGENIAYRGQKPSTPPPTSTTAAEHQDLFVDEGIEGRGHRTNLMNASFKEIGIGITTGVYNTYNALMSTQDFGYKSGNSFLTGIAFDDTVTADSFYTPGEGLGSVTITAVRSGGGTYTATTWASGGYSLQVPTGTYTVTASGGELSSPVQYTGVVVGSVNVKQDFRPGASPPSPPSPPVSPPVSPPPVSPPVSPPPASPPSSPPPSPPPPPPPVRGQITTAVWNDLNGDGKRQRKEPGLAGREVFLDVNGDAVRQSDELQVTTADDGIVAFSDLDPGFYQVVLTSAADWKLTSPGGTSRDVGVASQKAPKVAAFGLTQSVVVAGTVFADANANGIHDDGELPFRKAKVLIDLNGDGIRQQDERVAKIGKLGEFRFTGLTAGVYSLRLIMSPKFAATTPEPISVDVSVPASESLTNSFGVHAIV